jgi:quinolinate synthase
MRNREIFSGEVLAECRRRQDITLTLAQDFFKQVSKVLFHRLWRCTWMEQNLLPSVSRALLAMGYKNITMGDGAVEKRRRSLRLSKRLSHC